jgi:hypothetical protein
MNYVIEGEGALVNAKGEETPPESRRLCSCESKPFKMICGVPKEFE